MSIRGPHCAEGLDQLDLSRGRVEEVRTANDLVDRHLDVVDYHGELVGEHTVASSYDEVARSLGDALPQHARDAVLENDLSVLDGEPEVPGLLGSRWRLNWEKQLRVTSDRAMIDV